MDWVRDERRIIVAIFDVDLRAVGVRDPLDDPTRPLLNRDSSI